MFVCSFNNHFSLQNYTNAMGSSVTMQKHGKTWDWRTILLVVEMLVHCTPSSCISPNILSVLELFIPDKALVKELPSLWFVHNVRTLLQFMTKALAAFIIGKSESIDQTLTDSPNHRQTSLQALICGFMSDNDFNMVTLSSCIIAEEENAQSLMQSIIHAFKESGELLQAWRDVTPELFPN